MDVWDAWDIYIGILFAIAAIFFVVYRIKLGKARKVIAEAEAAMGGGRDGTAVSLFKQALASANEEPELELRIVGNLGQLYQRNEVEFDFTDFQTLVKQDKALAKKSSSKSMREYIETQGLKEKIVASMPDVT
jgi:hypothetical protein